MADETLIPAASPPAIDHPAAPVPLDTTRSLSTTRIPVPDTAAALLTTGAWPSLSGRSRAPPSRSTLAIPTATLPVASVGAPPGENVSVCVSVPPPAPPSSPVMVRGSPSTTSDE